MVGSVASTAPCVLFAPDWRFPTNLPNQNGILCQPSIVPVVLVLLANLTLQSQMNNLALRDFNAFQPRVADDGGSAVQRRSGAPVSQKNTILRYGTADEGGRISGVVLS